MLEVRIETTTGHREHRNLFVPFFTTNRAAPHRPPALPQIAENHGGTLSLRNREGGAPGCLAVLRCGVGAPAPVVSGNSCAAAGQNPRQPRRMFVATKRHKSTKIERAFLCVLVLFVLRILKLGLVAAPPPLCLFQSGWIPVTRRGSADFAPACVEPDDRAPSKTETLTSTAISTNPIIGTPSPIGRRYPAMTKVTKNCCLLANNLRHSTWLGTSDAIDPVETPIHGHTST